MSAIKTTLIDDNYDWDQNKVYLNTLTKACRKLNDTVRTRLPIHKTLLELILFELERLFSAQPYLECMYKALFSLYYYGLFRAGELAYGPHQLKAKNVQIATNKNKLLFILYTSKM